MKMTFLFGPLHNMEVDIEDAPSKLIAYVDISVCHPEQLRELGRFTLKSVYLRNEGINQYNYRNSERTDEYSSGTE